MATTLDRVLHAYRRELGTKESPRGSNRVRYATAYGLIGPWCHEFISVVAKEAGAGDIIPWAAYTPAGAAWFKARGRWHSTPKKGAIVYFEFPGMGRISHVGIVEAVHSDGSITTIEGNTDSSGGRTGGKVMRKRRARSLVAGYGYPAYISEARYQALKKAEAKRKASALAKAKAAAALAKKAAAAAVATRKRQAAAAAAALALLAGGVVATDGDAPAGPSPTPSVTVSPSVKPSVTPSVKPSVRPTSAPVPVQSRVVRYVKGKPFMSGADVQRIAKFLGVPKRKIRKGWGPTADTYLRAWQKAEKLKVDGEWGRSSTERAGWTWAP
jgi:surface antigen